MIFIATADTDLAKALLRELVGKKSICLRADNATDLRHQIHEAQPQVVVLDVRLGGQQWRAMDVLPRMQTVQSAPHVIVVAPWRSEPVEQEAARFDCYEVVNQNGPTFLAEIRGAVMDALLERRAGGLTRRPRRGLSVH